MEKGGVIGFWCVSAMGVCFRWWCMGLALNKWCFWCCCVISALIMWYSWCWCVWEVQCSGTTFALLELNKLERESSKWRQLSTERPGNPAPRRHPHTFQHYSFPVHFPTSMTSSPAPRWTRWGKTPANTRSYLLLIGYSCDIVKRSISFFPCSSVYIIFGVWDL